MSHLGIAMIRVSKDKDRDKGKDMVYRQLDEEDTDPLHDGRDNHHHYHSAESSHLHQQGE